MNTPDYNKLAQIRENYEGFRHNAYMDTGKVWTIGFGSTYNFSRNRKVKQGDYITRQEAMQWMQIEDENIIKQLNHYIQKDLSTNQTTALVDYIYNRGIGNFLKTRLDELINEDPNNPEIKQHFLGTGLWDRLGNKLWGLGRRRRTEWILYSTGQLKFEFLKWGKI